MVRKIWLFQWSPLRQEPEAPYNNATSRGIDLDACRVRSLQQKNCRCLFRIELKELDLTECYVAKIIQSRYALLSG